MFIHQPMLGAVEVDNRLLDWVIFLKGRDREGFCLFYKRDNLHGTLALKAG